MSRIFISYRREDSDIWVGRLVDELRKHFPPGQVFQDIASIDPGADFRSVLNDALITAGAMLVVIGPRWLSVTDKQGRKRLENQADLVRQEVAESLRRPEVRVFPLLLEGAEMPAEEDLPEPLKPLVQRQALELTVRHWTHDVAQLIQTLKRVPGLSDRTPEKETARQDTKQDVTRPEAEERAAKVEAERLAAQEQTQRNGEEVLGEEHPDALTSGHSSVQSVNARSGRADVQDLGRRVNGAVHGLGEAWIVSGSHDETLRLWDAETGQPIREPLCGHEASVQSVAFSPDGTRIVSGSGDKTLRLWDARTGQPIGEPLRGHQREVYSVAFSPDGTRIVSGSSDDTLRLWDAKTGQPIGEPLRGHESYVTSVAFSPDGTRIVSGSNDTMLRLWDAQTGQSIGEPLRAHEGTIFFGLMGTGVSSVAFNPDGTLIVSGGGKTVRLWDAASWQPIGVPLRGHEGNVYCVAFSPDGTRIVSSGHDRTLWLWDAKTGQPVGEPLRLRFGDVYAASVAFSPDGTRVVSGHYNDTLRLWDVKSGRPVGESLRGHKGIIHSVAFSSPSARAP